MNPLSYNLLEEYRQNRDKVLTLTDITALFVLAFVNQIGGVRVEQLARDLGITEALMREKISPLLRGALMNEAGAVVSVTEAGRQLLDTIGLVAPPPAPPSGPPSDSLRPDWGGLFKGFFITSAALGVLTLAIIGGFFFLQRSPPTRIPVAPTSPPAIVIPSPTDPVAIPPTPTRTLTATFTATPTPTFITPTATPTSSPTHTPSLTREPRTEVVVSSVWITDQSGTAKTTFAPGDPITLHGIVFNNSISPQNAFFNWQVAGPCFIAPWSGNLTTNSGEQPWNLERSIPTGNCAGNYSYSLIVTFTGTSSQKATGFTIIQLVTPTPTRTITLTPTRTRTPTRTLTPLPQTITLYPSADAYVYECFKNTNYNTDKLDVGYYGDPDCAQHRMRALVRFDLAPVPQTATILNATLYAYALEGAPGNTTIGVYRIAGNWIQTSVTWNNQPAFAADAYDTDTEGLGWWDWDVTKLVSEWNGGNYVNYGFKLVNPNEASGIANSRMFGSSQHATPANRIQLYIKYQP